jgi:hypothetical protein
MIYQTQSLESFIQANREPSALQWKMRENFTDAQRILAQASGKSVSATVVGEHTLNKEIAPAVQYTVGDTGLTVTITSDYEKAKVTIQSPKPVNVRDFGEWFDKYTKVSTAYCPGIPLGKVFGPFRDNAQNFTVSIPEGRLNELLQGIAQQFKGHAKDDLRSGGLRGERGDVNPTV